jgi:hypothetical protein
MARFFKLVALKRLARTLRASQIKPVPLGPATGGAVELMTADNHYLLTADNRYLGVPG